MNVTLTKERIDELAAEHESISSFIFSLYLYIYGVDVWNQIAEIDTSNYPQCGHETWRHICQICIDKSTDSPPSGGMFWMNKGFSADEGYAEWKVWVRPVRLEDGSYWPTHGDA